MIIIPDIHGRTFWEEAVKLKEEGEKVLFLGDYMEPYGFENITSDDSYENFQKIIEYKKENMEDCILLLGNHDFACIDDNMISCRHDYKNSKRNTKIFKDNETLFQMAYSEKIGEITYLFTHAGVHSEWLHNLTAHEHADVAEYLNRIYRDDFKRLKKYLTIMSSYRTSWTRYSYGSCIWADVREFADKEMASKEIEPEFDNTFQIFGHTLHFSGKPIDGKWFSCIDIRNAFRLYDDTGRLEQLTFIEYNDEF